MQNVVSHRISRNFRFINFVCGGVMKELANQLVDTTIKSGREQEPLSVLGGLGKNLTDMLEKAKLCHVVCFVEDGDLHIVERHVARLHEIDHSAWAGDDNVDAVAKCSDLSVVCHAAVHSGVAQAHLASEWCDDVTNLVRQLACRREDDGPGCTSAAFLFTLGETGKKRKHECQGLAASGATTAQYVTTCKGVFDCGYLNGEWFCDSLLGESLDELCGKCEVGKRARDRRGPLKVHGGGTPMWIEPQIPGCTHG